MLPDADRTHADVALPAALPAPEQVINNVKHHAMGDVECRHFPDVDLGGCDFTSAALPYKPTVKVIAQRAEVGRAWRKEWFPAGRMDLQRLQFGPGLSYRFGRDESDSPRLRGLGDGDNGADLGTFVRWNMRPIVLVDVTDVVVVGRLLRRHVALPLPVGDAGFPAGA